MKIASLFTLFVLTCIGAFAQLDTVYRLTKSFDHEINGLKPQQMFVTVLNEQGDTLELAEYNWSLSNLWMPYLRYSYTRTDSSVITVKSSWKQNERKWYKLLKSEYTTIDSISCVFSYEWNEEDTVWTPLDGRGLCAGGYLSFYNESRQLETAYFKNIHFRFEWDRMSNNWIYSSKALRSADLMYSFRNGKWVLIFQKYPNVNFYYDRSLDSVLFVEEHDTVINDYGSTIETVVFRDSSLYSRRVQSYNNMKKPVSDSVFGDCSSLEGCSLSHVRFYEYVHDTVLVKETLLNEFSKNDQFYDSAGDLIESVLSFKNPANNLWVNWLKTVITSDNSCKTDIAYRWDADNSTWDLYSKRRACFDADGFTVAIYNYLWNDEANCWQGESSSVLVSENGSPYWLKYNGCDAQGTWIKGEGKQLLYEPERTEPVGEINYISDDSKSGPVPVNKIIYDSDTSYVYDRYSESFVPDSKDSYLYYADKRIKKKVRYSYCTIRHGWDEASSTEWYYSLADLEVEYEIDKEYKPLAVASGKPEVAKLYPTIASDVLFVELPESCALLRIFSPQGALVYSQKDVPAGVNPISVSFLESGFYVLVLDENRSVSFIKQ